MTFFSWLVIGAAAGRDGRVVLAMGKSPFFQAQQGALRRRPVKARSDRWLTEFNNS